MVRPNRGLLGLIALAACIVAGCGGGSGGGGPTSPATLAPLVNSRPLAAGDKFGYAGTTVNAQVFDGSSPPASSTTTAQVAQSIAVSGPTTYNGLTDAFDYKNAETDTSPLQQIGMTTDTFYGLRPAATAGFTDFVTSGFTASDTLGERTVVTLGSGNQLADILPETAGKWSNDGAQTIATTEADGTSETRTYASNGSYTDTTTYPQGSQFTPQPTPLVATIVENADGSGTYSLPLFGASPNATISFGTPNPAGDVPIVVRDPGVIETVTPAAFYSPGPLYEETDVLSVGRTIPAACKSGASFGTAANTIVQSAKRVDTVLGTIESLSQTSYVVPSDGVACLQLTDTTNVYYDYSGQSNNGPIGITFAGGPTPTEVDTITTTLGLTSASVQSLAVANARANFLAAVVRARLMRKKRALVELRARLRKE